MIALAVVVGLLALVLVYLFSPSEGYTGLVPRTLHAVVALCGFAGVLLVFIAAFKVVFLMPSHR